MNFGCYLLISICYWPFFALFYVAQILRPLCSSDPESDPEQEKSRRSGTHVTSGIWQISGTKGESMDSDGFSLVFIIFSG